LSIFLLLRWQYSTGILTSANLVTGWLINGDWKNM